MKRSAALLLLAMVMVPAARASTLGLHLVSHHWPDAGRSNINPGLYWRGDSGATVGAYRNSVRRTSAYAGWTFQVVGPIDLTVGAITGYHRDPSPLLVPTVRLGAGFRLALMPAREKGTTTALHLSWETDL